MTVKLSVYGTWHLFKLADRVANWWKSNDTSHMHKTIPTHTSRYKSNVITGMIRLVINLLCVRRSPFTTKTMTMTRAFEFRYFTSVFDMKLTWIRKVDCWLAFDKEQTKYDCDIFLLIVERERARETTFVQNNNFSESICSRWLFLMFAGIKK